MKKQDVTAGIVYILILGVVIFFGITVLQKRAGVTNMVTWQYILYIIGAIILGVILNPIIFELAHVAGAKVGRYDVISTNVLGFCFYRENGVKKFKFSSFDGLTGETKIVPKADAKKEPNPHAFCLFGTLFFAIEVVIVILLYIIMYQLDYNAIEKTSVYLDIAYFFIIIVFIGGMILLYNIMPLQLDSITDGYRLTLVSNPKNKVAFNELLRVEHEIAMGNTNVEIKTFSEITNFTADLNLNKVYMCLDKGDLKTAEELLNMIVENKQNISERVYINALAQIVYIKIMTLPLAEAEIAVKQVVPVTASKEISLRHSMMCLRATILIEGLFNKSKYECYNALAFVNKAYKQTPKARQATEVELFNKAIMKVHQEHPKWELDQYLLSVKK